MAGLALTAWAIHHPRGNDAEALLRGLGGDPGPAAETSAEPTEALLEALAPACGAAAERWGPSRIAVILGSNVPDETHPLARLGQTLQQVRRRTGVVGPAYHVAALGVGGARALASAQRLLAASLADAAIVGGIDEEHGALMLVEKHGDAFVRLLASAEATAPAGVSGPDRDTAARVMEQAWAQVGRQPLGYVHLHKADEASVERTVATELFGGTAQCSTGELRPGVTTGAVDVVLAAAALARGYAPQPDALELAHDRTLLHAYSSGGQHVALVFGTRP